MFCTQKHNIWLLERIHRWVGHGHFKNSTEFAEVKITIPCLHSMPTLFLSQRHHCLCVEIIHCWGFTKLPPWPFSKWTPFNKYESDHCHDSKNYMKEGLGTCWFESANFLVVAFLIGTNELRASPVRLHTHN